MINLKADSTKQYIYTLFDKYSGELLHSGTVRECANWLDLNRNKPRKIYLSSIVGGLGKTANCKDKFLLNCRVTRVEG